MPSGRTHDRITLWSLPLVTGLAYGQTQDGNLTLILSGGFLFGGLMFGPDLDIHSRQYRRWGWLRWIWLPYRKLFRHRSFWSHGPIAGTTLRLLYLTGWVALFGLIGLAIASRFQPLQLDWEAKGLLIKELLRQHWQELIAFYLGIELGAMSHSLSDWGISAYKRVKKRGWSELFPQNRKNNKRHL